MRITPHLIRTRDGIDVWAESYEEPYDTGIFQIQSEIAERVAGALSVTLLAGERQAVEAVPTRNLEAYDYFLRGRASTGLGQNWEGQRVALEMYSKATLLDPGFALAHAWIANNHLTMIGAGYDLSLPTGVTAAQRLELARAAANRALAIEPDLPEGHAALAGYYGSVRDTARQRAELDWVLRTQPSDAEAFSRRGSALLGRNRVREGIEAFERAHTLDPRSPQRLDQLAWALANAGQYQRAEAYWDLAIDLTPDHPGFYLAKAWLHVVQGQLDSARGVVQEGVRRSGATNLLVVASKSSGLIRLLRILRQEYGPAMRSLHQDVYGADSADYFWMKTIAHWSAPILARAYYDSLARWARLRLDRDRDNPDYRLVLARGLAGSGRRAGAVAEITMMFNAPPYNQPLKFLGAGDRIAAAETCVLAGLPDRALDLIEIAMTVPAELNRFLLQLDPIWDPLRKLPRFQKLLERK